jgi:hypothetical protein
VVERWLPPKAQPNAAAVEDSLRLSGACHAIAGLFGITVLEPYPATVRALVCGRAHDPAGTKAMVIRTMIMRGYLPNGCTDGDRADACCLFCWAEATRYLSDPARFALTQK